MGGAAALIDAVALAVGIVADMAGMDDDEVFAMMGMRPVPIGGDLAADPAVVSNRKGPEMLELSDDQPDMPWLSSEQNAREGIMRSR